MICSRVSFQYVCVYVCVCRYIYTNIYVYIHAHIHTHINTHARTYTHICVLRMGEAIFCFSGQLHASKYDIKQFMFANMILSSSFVREFGNFFCTNARYQIRLLMMVKIYNFLFRIQLQILELNLK